MVTTVGGKKYKRNDRRASSYKRINARRGIQSRNLGNRTESGMSADERAAQIQAQAEADALAVRNAETLMQANRFAQAVQERETASQGFSSGFAGSQDQSRESGYAGPPDMIFNRSGLAAQNAINKYNLQKENEVATNELLNRGYPSPSVGLLAVSLEERRKREQAPSSRTEGLSQAVERQALRQKQYEESAGAKRLDTFSSLVTGGKGLSIEQRGFAGQTAQKTVRAFIGWPFDLGASASAAAEKGYLAVRGLSNPQTARLTKKELDRAAKKTPGEIFAQLDPTTPAGLSNVIVIGGTALVGAANAKRPPSVKNTRTVLDKPSKLTTTFEELKQPSIQRDRIAGPKIVTRSGVVEGKVAGGSEILARFKEASLEFKGRVKTDSTVEAVQFGTKTVRKPLLGKGNKGTTPQKSLTQEVTVEGITRQKVSLRGVSKPSGQGSTQTGFATVTEQVFPLPSQKFSSLGSASNAAIKILGGEPTITTTAVKTVKGYNLPITKQVSEVFGTIKETTTTPKGKIRTTQTGYAGEAARKLYLRNEESGASIYAGQSILDVVARKGKPLKTKYAADSQILYPKELNPDIVVGKAKSIKVKNSTTGSSEVRSATKSLEQFQTLTSEQFIGDFVARSARKVKQRPRKSSKFETAVDSLAKPKVIPYVAVQPSQNTLSRTDSSSKPVQRPESIPKIKFTPEGGIESRPRIAFRQSTSQKSRQEQILNFTQQTPSTSSNPLVPQIPKSPFRNYALIPPSGGGSFGGNYGRIKAKTKKNYTPSLLGVELNLKASKKQKKAGGTGGSGLSGLEVRGL